MIQRLNPVEAKGLMQLYSGKKFDLNHFSPSDFDIRDIAHALSQICRFTGQCSSFYSVAQHCTLMAGLIDNRRWRRTALLHDASEAYIGDVSMHLKTMIPLYSVLEAHLMIDIAQCFEIDWPVPDEIKQLDRDMLETEFRDVWTVDEFPDRPVYGIPLDICIVPVLPQVAERDFLKMYNTCS